MKAIKILRFFVVIVLLLTSSSCMSITRQTPKEQHFREMFPDIPMSGYLKVVFRHSTEGMGTKWIEVENISDAVIDISKIAEPLYWYKETEHQWVAISNHIIYEEPLRLYPKEDAKNGQMKSWVIVIDPDLTGFEQPITLRAAIIGEIIENGQAAGKKVGGYIDLEFK